MNPDQPENPAHLEFPNKEFKYPYFETPEHWRNPGKPSMADELTNGFIVTLWENGLIELNNNDPSNPAFYVPTQKGKAWMEARGRALAAIPDGRGRVHNKNARGPKALLPEMISQGYIQKIKPYKEPARYVLTEKGAVELGVRRMFATRKWDKMRHSAEVVETAGGL